MNEKIISLLEKQCDLLTEIDNKLSTIESRVNAIAGHGYDTISDITSGLDDVRSAIEDLKDK
jgi:hypothetical protein